MVNVVWSRNVHSCLCVCDNLSTCNLCVALSHGAESIVINSRHRSETTRAAEFGCKHAKNTPPVCLEMVTNESHWLLLMDATSSFGCVLIVRQTAGWCHSLLNPRGLSFLLTFTWPQEYTGCCGCAISVWEIRSNASDAVWCLYKNLFQYCSRDGPVWEIAVRKSPRSQREQQGRTRMLCWFLSIDRAATRPLPHTHSHDSLLTQNKNRTVLEDCSWAEVMSFVCICLKRTNLTFNTIKSPVPPSTIDYILNNFAL